MNEYREHVWCSGKKPKALSGLVIGVSTKEKLKKIQWVIK